MSALLGMHPRMGHVPPTRSRSMTATLASASAARAAAFMPAMPAPMTIRSTSATGGNLPPPGPAQGSTVTPRQKATRSTTIAASGLGSG